MPGQGGAEQTLLRGHQRRAGLVRFAAVAVAGVVLAAGCTARDTPDPAGPSPTQTPSVSPSPEPSPATAEALEIEFEYQVPEQPCPPVSALSTLAYALMPYTLASTYLSDRLQFAEDGPNIFMICGYQPAAMVDDEEVVTQDDHVWFRARSSLFREWGSGVGPGLAYTFAAKDFPLASQDVNDWLGVDTLLPRLRDRGVWREGCGPEATPCTEGDEPTIQTREWYSSTAGRVGNLHITLESRYIAQELPPEAEQTITDLYREFVLAIVDSWEHAD